MFWKRNLDPEITNDAGIWNESIGSVGMKQKWELEMWLAAKRGNGALQDGPVWKYRFGHTSSRGWQFETYYLSADSLEADDYDNFYIKQ
jgi:hypothetical protein